MKTLAEMNTSPKVYPWSGYTIRTEFAVGRVGRARSGTKLHLVICSYVVTVPNDGGRMRVGDLHAAHTPCNGNGQHIAQPINGLDTDAITCQKCVSAIGS